MLSKNGDCVLIGHKKNPFNASIINGTSVHGEDFDDTLRVLLFMLGLLWCDVICRTNQQFIWPGIFKRVSNWFRAHLQTSSCCTNGSPPARLSSNSNFGAFGSSIGISSVIGSDIKQMSSALGIVGSMASGIIEYLAEGTSTKRLHPGWAAGCYQSANIAKSGFLGPRTVFEGNMVLSTVFLKILLNRIFRI